MFYCHFTNKGGKQDFFLRLGTADRDEHPLFR